VRKIVCAVLVIMMFFMMIGGFITPRAKAETPIYGNVYLFAPEIPALWNLFKLNWSLYPPVLLNINPCDMKVAGLVNTGKILGIFIMIPLEFSHVIIFYKDTLYRYSLIPYKVNKHCIIFTFKGEIS